MSDHLVRAAKARRDAATAKAQSAVRQLSGQGQRISFAAVARQAGVSTDFLYRHPELRATITSLRSRSGHAASIDADEESLSSSTTAAVRALSARMKQLIRQHRDEVAALQRDLAAAHGENLLLRRRLAAHEDVVP